MPQYAPVRARLLALGQRLDAVRGRGPTVKVQREFDKTKDAVFSGRYYVAPGGGKKSKRYYCKHSPERTEDARIDGVKNHSYNCHHID